MSVPKGYEGCGTRSRFAIAVRVGRAYTTNLSMATDYHNLDMHIFRCRETEAFI